jgi:hypothetical protein
MDCNFTSTNSLTAIYGSKEPSRCLLSNNTKFAIIGQVLGEIQRSSRSNKAVCGISVIVDALKCTQCLTDHISACSASLIVIVGSKEPSQCLLSNAIKFAIIGQVWEEIQ